MLYIPSMVANFKLTFDESVRAQVPITPSSVDGLVKSGGAVPSLWSSSTPAVLSRTPVAFVNNRVPKKATVQLAGYRQAASFSMTLDFRELPLDPRTLRASAVDIHLGSVSEDDFARGVLSAKLFGGVKTSVLDTSRFFNPSTSDTLILTAIIDEWEVSHADISEIRLRGRDLRGALIDTPIAVDPRETSQLLDSLEMLRPIDAVVAQIIGFSPLFSQLKIVTNPAEWPRGILPAPGFSAMPRHRKGAKGLKVGGRASSSSDKMSIWDLVVKVCYLVGAIPYVTGTELVIRPARSLYDQKRAGVDPTVLTPFSGGVTRKKDAQTGAAITPLRIRRLVYGRDVKELSVTRRFGGYRRPQRVRCVGTDDDSFDRGKTRRVQGIWPPESKSNAKRSRVAAGGAAAQEDLITVPVAGIRDAERLEQIAQSIYEEIGRGEVSGNVTTPALASFGGDNSDPDLLRLRPGDAIELATDTRSLQASSPLVSELTNNQRIPFEQQVADIAKRLGGDTLLATAIVSTSRSQSIQRFFRVSAVTFEWSTSGLSIGADFHNYIEKVFDGGSSDTGLPGAATRKTVGK